MAIVADPNPPDTYAVMERAMEIAEHAAIDDVEPPRMANPTKAVGKSGNQALGNNSTARAIFIDGTGRTRATKDHEEDTAALATTGACE